MEDAVEDSIDALRSDMNEARDTNERLNRRCQKAEAALGDKLTRLGLFNAGLVMYAAQRDEALARVTELETALSLLEDMRVSREDDIAGLRAALLGMVRAWGDMCPDGLIGTSDSEWTEKENTALAAALRVLGLPDPCPVEQLPEA